MIVPPWPYHLPNQRPRVRGKQAIPRSGNRGTNGGIGRRETEPRTIRSSRANPAILRSLCNRSIVSLAPRVLNLLVFSLLSPWPISLSLPFPQTPPLDKRAPPRRPRDCACTPHQRQIKFETACKALPRHVVFCVVWNTCSAECAVGSTTRLRYGTHAHSHESNVYTREHTSQGLYVYTVSQYRHAPPPDGAESLSLFLSLVTPSPLTLGSLFLSLSLQRATLVLLRARIQPRPRRPQSARWIDGQV